jgi:nucleoside-diphosphate-sugar epimerase
MKRVLVTGGSGFIGIHLVDHLICLGYEVSNLDINPPLNGLNIENWQKTSILELQEIESHILNFQPHFIVHLAAVTTQDAKSLNEFEVNILGTEILLKASSRLENLQKFIFTSTQYVVTPGASHSTTTSTPYGLYGASKLEGENLTQEILEFCSWTVIRPTAIWGPWHPILSQGLWRQIYKRRYFHPTRDFAVKGYGYVKNCAWQIEKILQAPDEVTSGKIFYIGDGNLRQSAWVSAFSQALRGRKLFYVPRIMIFLLSELGEVLIKRGIAFPIFRSRFRNLVTSNPAPLETTLSLFGTPPVSLDEAINETAQWYLSLENSGRTTPRSARG